MFIKKEDFGYFGGLNKDLNEAGKKRFLDTLLKSAGKKSGMDISKIQVVGRRNIRCKGNWGSRNANKNHDQKGLQGGKGEIV